MTLHVSSEVESKLRTFAAKEGLEPSAFVEKLITDYKPEEQPAEPDPTLALFAQWHKEDAQMTREEAEQEAQLWRDFEKGVNDTRRSLGMETL